jgi:HPt (histidine-containing phosphotransfer) domain-containing protein
MRTDKPTGEGFLSDLLEMADRIGLTHEQRVAVVEFIRRQEAELVKLAAEIASDDTPNMEIQHHD